MHSDDETESNRDGKGSSEAMDPRTGAAAGNGLTTRIQFADAVCGQIQVAAVPVLPGSTSLRDAVNVLRQVAVPMAVENGGELLGILSMADVFSSLADQLAVSKARAGHMVAGVSPTLERASGKAGAGLGGGAGSMFGHLGADGQLQSTGSLVARSPWERDPAGILTADANSSSKSEHICACLDECIAFRCQSQSDASRDALESLLGQGVLLFLLTADIVLAVADLLVGHSSVGIRTTTVVVLALFLIEIIVRLVAYGSRFLNTYALLDVTVVFISLLEIVLFELVLNSLADANTRAVIIIVGRSLRLIRVVRGIARFIAHQKAAVSRTKKLVS